MIELLSKQATELAATADQNISFGVAFFLVAVSSLLVPDEKWGEDKLKRFVAVTFGILTIAAWHLTKWLSVWIGFVAVMLMMCTFNATLLAVMPVFQNPTRDQNSKARQKTRRSKR